MHLNFNRINSALKSSIFNLLLEFFHSNPFSKALKRKGCAHIVLWIFFSHPKAHIAFVQALLKIVQNRYFFFLNSFSIDIFNLKMKIYLQLHLPMTIKRNAWLIFGSIET